MRYFDVPKKQTNVAKKQMNGKHNSVPSTLRIAMDYNELFANPSNAQFIDNDGEFRPM